MLKLDPELLSDSGRSPYRRELAQGYRWLRFAAPLEREFRHFHARAHLLRVRWSTGLAIVMFGLFTVVNVRMLPANLWIELTAFRFVLVLPLFFAIIWASYRPACYDWLQRLQTLAALMAGISINAALMVAMSNRLPFPYEGLLLATLFIYFVAWLLWWRALLINLGLLAMFALLEWHLQPDAGLRTFHLVLMLCGNMVGAVGSYFIEHGARSNFLVTALLRELAEHDGLTGLYNRRTFNAHLDRLWRQTQRDGSWLALAMIDVDHFKRFNDQYGHAAGDRALQAVAGAIAGQARRPFDMAARYGGEEFVLLWHHPDGAELPALVEQLRAAVEALAIPHAGSEHGSLTISVGATLADPGRHAHPEAALRTADEALYLAKAGGRNRCVIK
ncbi:GGDEF domain-containing protein [Chitinimonas koreensis]|uniref:GGDEF domain-containing protein n=1 Tax=Chitinimonas koreensis TaxID=356302 RepID=UPI000426F94A|nr:GGDEF domain-containing protein [Chitinimonas koreensis]QNM98600.1 GGDEF domain-containing protein [Chitinimonas koreensis]